MPVGRVIDPELPLVELPCSLAEVLRPELSSLASEIVGDIQANIPEYARPLDGPYGKSIKEGVEYALHLFVDQVEDPAMSKEASLQVHRKLGHQEMREGRSLDNLQAAYRIGARVAWRRLMEVGRRAKLSSEVMSELADAMLAFMDELASVALDGYLEAKASMGGALDTWRRRLLGLIMEQPQAPRAAITELAELTRWPVPDSASAVAVHPRRGTGQGDLPHRLDAGMLAELTGNFPHLLAPGEITGATLAEIEKALPGRRFSVGPCVPLEAAAESLRLARETLALAGEGAIPKQRVTWSEEHLPTLLLHTDDAIVDRLRRRWFGHLDELTAKQRERMIATLRAWLDAHGSMPEMALMLGVHAQTVRYRMGLLESTFGDSLRDPDARFEMHLVLRADLPTP